MKATRGMIAKIHVLAKKLDMEYFTLHAFLLQKVGKDSMSSDDFTTTDAGKAIEALEHELATRGIPNIPPGRASGRDQARIMRLVHELQWHEVKFWHWAKKVIGHDIPKGSNHFRWSWITEREAKKLLWGLLAIKKRQTA